MGYDGLDSVINATGINSLVYIDAGGTITTFRGYHQQGSHVTSGTIINYYGYYWQKPTKAAITNEYGLYIEAPTLGSVIREGIHNEGSLNQVGNVTLGGTVTISTKAGVSASGGTCAVTEITSGIITGASCVP
jgi:hypothetical protein